MTALGKLHELVDKTAHGDITVAINDPVVHIEQDATGLFRVRLKDPAQAPLVTSRIQALKQYVVTDQTADQESGHVDLIVQHVVDHPPEHLSSPSDTV